MPHIPRPKPGSRSGPPTADGYVYLIRMQGLYKIGRCRSWKSRSKGYSGMPYPVELVCLLRSVCMQKLEQDLHRKYDRKRLSGEWFRLDQREVDEICNHPLRVEREE